MYRVKEILNKLSTDDFSVIVIDGVEVIINVSMVDEVRTPNILCCICGNTSLNELEDVMELVLLGKVKYFWLSVDSNQLCPHHLPFRLFPQRIVRNMKDKGYDQFPYSKEYQEKLVDKVRPKYFLCLNRIVKCHRLIVVNSLFQLGLQDKGFISLLGPHKGNLISPLNIKTIFNNIDKKYGYFNEIDEYVSNNVPLVLDIEPIDESLHTESVNQWCKTSYWFVDQSYVEQTYFSIVTESRFSFDDGNVHISEKTWKALLWNPFIVVGDFGVLKKLKEYGFKTFPELFDESYDEIKDNGERINAILEEIKRVCDIPLEKIHELYVNKLLPKVIYNQHHLIKLYGNPKDDPIQIQELAKQSDFNHLER